MLVLCSHCVHTVFIERWLYYPYDKYKNNRILNIQRDMQGLVYLREKKSFHIIFNDTLIYIRLEIQCQTV